VRRGEVWWANLPAPAGRRPVLLLTRDSAYAVRTSVTVAPITRTVRSIPVEVPLDQADGMPSACVVNCDDLLTIPQRLLPSRITALTPAKMQAVAVAIAFALDLP